MRQMRQTENYHFLKKKAYLFYTLISDQYLKTSMH